MSKRVVLRIATVLLLAVGVCSCRTRPPQDAGAPDAPPLPYLQIDRTQTGRVALQTALRQFVPRKGKGPSIWLASAVHLGSPEYFAQLQASLDEEELVLFEGIGGGPRGAHQANRAGNGETPTSAPHVNSGLQGELAAALGLRFQLDAIDYDRASFRNSDLSIEELRQLLSEQKPQPGEASASEGFESLLQTMRGQSMVNVIMRILLPFVASNPALQGAAKLALLEVLGGIGGDPANIEGLPEDAKQLLEVLLQRRNERVINDLEAEVHAAPPPKSIGVLYGVGHMVDLEKRLRSQLRYRPQTNCWITAFAVDYEKAHLSQAQVKFVQNLIQQQLQFTGEANK
jgi:hypothetical protein